VKIYGQFANFQGGTAAATAAIAALIARPREKGQFVDVSVQDANVTESAIALQRWADGVLETRATRSFRYGGVLECQDGEIEVLTLEQHQWEALVQLSGESGWADSGDFDDSLERSRRGAEINRHLRAWAKRNRVDEVVRRGRELGVPIVRYASPGEVLGDVRARARGLFANVTLADETAFPVLLAPFQFSATPAALRSAPPKLDERRREPAHV
jgi:crotonobetainyl-CoA:carnitine CoA-transferase CaiB-like acyl-CoA transferase